MGCVWATEYASCHSVSDPMLSLLRQIGITSATKNLTIIRTGRSMVTISPAMPSCWRPRNRVFARHPKTQFIALQPETSRRSGHVSDSLDHYPNMNSILRPESESWAGSRGPQRGSSTNTRIASSSALTLHHMAMRHRSRSSTTSCTKSITASWRGGRILRLCSSERSPQGRWRIYGIELPEAILKKVTTETRHAC